MKTFKVGVCGNNSMATMIELSIFANIEKYNGKIVDFKDLDGLKVYTIKGRRVFNHTVKQFKKNSGYSVLKIKDVWVIKY